MTRPTNRVPDLRWQAWGEAGHEPSLPHGALALLAEVLGVRAPAPSAVDDAAARLADPALPAAAAAGLADAVGADQVRTDRATRLRHATGKSTVDLLRCRAGGPLVGPDAVVLPGSHEEVLAVLRCCAEHRVAVVPFGGGTSVVGGAEPVRGPLPAVVALDLRRLDRLVELDTESATATLQPGLRAPEAEELLAGHGLTLGHVPQSFEYATVGGFAATRSSGQASAGYGRFDELVVGLQVATPAGTLRLGRAPASAAGPDLRQLFLGSEGTLGVITEVTVRVRPVPASQVDEAWSFPDFGTGTAALRELAQRDAMPTVLRLSDEAESAVNAALSGGGSDSAAGGVVAIACYEGDAGTVAARRSAATAIIAAAGGTPLGEAAATAWRRDRFAGPYLRDRLLDAGALVETVETATSWRRLPVLYRAVQAALTGALPGPAVVLCHISHVYPTGASLYFTVATAAAADPVGQWQAAKQAASAAIVGAGGTISHHHGVGTDHRDWLTAEIGELGVAVLRAVKRTLDPTGILNPGKLLPD